MADDKPTGVIKRNKITLGDIFSGSLDGAIDNAIRYVLIPKFAEMFINSATSIATYLVNGSNSSGPVSTSTSSNGRVITPYHNMSGTKKIISGKVDDRYNISMTAFTDAGRVEDILQKMKAYASAFPAVTAFQFYDFAKLNTTVTDKDYGWISESFIEKASVGVDYVDGNAVYFINVPKAVHLD